MLPGNFGLSVLIFFFLGGCTSFRTEQRGGRLEVEANLACAGLNSNHVGRGGRTVLNSPPLHGRRALVQHRGHTPAPAWGLGGRYCAVIPKVAYGTGESQAG